MNIRKSLALTFFLIGTINAQEGNELAWKNLELFLGVRGISTSETDSIVFKMKSISPLYNNEPVIIQNGVGMFHQFPPSESTHDYFKNLLFYNN